MVYVPIIGAISLATGNFLERLVLKRRKISVYSYNILSFLGIVLLMLPFLGLFWKVDERAFSFASIGIFFLVILLSIGANLFNFYSIKGEKLGTLEPAKISEQLFVVLLSLVFSYFFGATLYERNFKAIIPGIIASVALMFPYFKKSHIKLNKYFIAAVFASFLFAMELIVSRLILDYYSSFSFYFLRCLGIFLISLVFFRKSLFQVGDKKVFWEILFTSFIWIIYRISIYYGYVTLGIVSTTLVVMLAPVFVYIFAHVFLKEKFNWRNLVSTIIIVLCVLFAGI